MAMVSEQEQFTALEQAGWVKMDIQQGFTGYIGPYWRKQEEQGTTIGLLVAERHANTHIGSLHGGALMSFADIGLGMGVVFAMGEKAQQCVTTSLNTQFVGIAKMGDFVTLQPEVVRQTRQLVFVRGLVKSGDKVIANVDGIWKLLEGELKRPD